MNTMNQKQYLKKINKIAFDNVFLKQNKIKYYSFI